MRTSIGTACAAAALAGIAACGPAPSSSPSSASPSTSPSPSASPSSSAPPSAAASPCYRTGQYDGANGCFAGGQIVTVARVLDAATIVLTDGRRVRLMGVVVPAIGSCAGPAAFGFASSKVVGQTINLITTGALDPYGSLWAYAQFGLDLATDLGQALAAQGWADAFAGSPATTAYISTVSAAVGAARTAKLGQFGPPCTPPPAPKAPAPKPRDDPAPRDEYQYEEAPEQREDDQPKRRSGQTGHPCLPGERDGDGDGYCGEGR